MNPIINRKQDILYKDLAVDLTAHRVSRAGHELLLTPREFALLAEGSTVQLSRQWVPAPSGALSGWY